MTRATCRCGQVLKAAPDEDGRVVCPSCGSRVRIRRRSPEAPEPIGSGDDYIRFNCSCGRRLKVPAASPPSYGKCPDCGRIVPVPQVGVNAHEARTEEFTAEELKAIKRWAADHKDKGSRVPVNVSAGTPDATWSGSDAQAGRVEAGLRLCPNCQTPVHLGSETCRKCGTQVPRRPSA